MPSLSADEQRHLMEVAIKAIVESASGAGDDPDCYMINRVLEVEADGSWQIFDLPATS